MKFQRKYCLSHLISQRYVLRLTRTSVSPCGSQTPVVAPSEQQRGVVLSHLPYSFRRCFSQQVSDHKVVNTLQEEIEPVSEPFSSNEASLAKLPFSPPPATPVKDVDACKILDLSSKGTPAPHVSTPARLTSAMPVLLEDKRCYMSPDDDSNQSPNKLVRCSSRSRSLKFDTPVKGASIDESKDLSVHDDILDILPENLIQSIREKERKALLEQDPAISQAKWRKKMISGLPKLFDTIYFLFQSSIITKEELVHKKVLNHLDILDTREVEDQLRLLKELVPEWICEKLALSRDLLICVKEISCPDLIRTRLAEAK